MMRPGLAAVIFSMLPHWTEGRVSQYLGVPGVPLSLLHKLFYSFDPSPTAAKKK